MVTELNISKFTFCRFIGSVGSGMLRTRDCCERVHMRDVLVSRVETYVEGTAEAREASEIGGEIDVTRA